jgi:hypothetical protein
MIRWPLERLTENDLTVLGTSNIPAQRTFQALSKKHLLHFIVVGRKE